MLRTPAIGSASALPEPDGRTRVWNVTSTVSTPGICLGRGFQLPFDRVAVGRDRREQLDDQIDAAAIDLDRGDHAQLDQAAADGRLLHAGDRLQHALFGQLIPDWGLCNRHREDLDFLVSYQD